MAGVTLTRRENVTEITDHQATDVTVWPVVQSRELMDTLNSYLRRTLAQANHPQPNEQPKQSKTSATHDPWRIVAPGVAVRASEYEARFGHLDLNDLRKRLTPEAFRAFVRHIGIIRGPADVDVNLLTNEELR